MLKVNWNYKCPFLWKCPGFPESCEKCGFFAIYTKGEIQLNPYEITSTKLLILALGHEFLHFGFDKLCFPKKFDRLLDGIAYKIGALWHTRVRRKEMMDRQSTTEVGMFLLHVDRDHRGRFRGQQAMSIYYRGWHYHVEHPILSQNAIMTFLERELKRMGAVEVTNDFPSIGVVASTPRRMTVWKLGDRQTVLWISQVTDGLHIETNKAEECAKGILTKKMLIDTFRNKTHFSYSEVY